MNRRGFLLGAVGAMGGVVLASLGYDQLSRQQRISEFAQTHCGGKTSMAKRVLIVYASRFGSTAEIAEAMGQAICDKVSSVDVLPVQKAKGVSGYDLIVLGGAARMGKILPETVRFAKKHGEALQSTPVAYFCSGMAMSEDTAEKRAEMMGYLDPLCAIAEPVSLGLFGGNVDPTRMKGFFKLMFGNVKEGPMAPNDARNWDSIRDWAVSLV